MRNWARLRVTGGDEGDDFAMGMIAQAVKNGIQASRKRAARRCIGSESSKEQAQCHGTRVLSPNSPDVRPILCRGASRCALFGGRFTNRPYGLEETGPDTVFSRVDVNTICIYN